MKYFYPYIVAMALLFPVCATAQDDADKTKGEESSSDIEGDIIPDLRDDDFKLKYEGKKSRNYLVVPIPMSSPTFGTGLILGGAYYYPQTEQQKATQAASYTAAAVGYTSNQSWFGGVMQQNYFAEDKWRFNAVAAYADLKLELLPPEEGEEQSQLDWVVKGSIFQASVDRRLSGDWYLGMSLRYLDITQDLDFNTEPPEFDLEQQIRSPGVGLKLQFDSRDVPSNPYRGRQFELKAIFADQSNTDNGTYESYSASFKSYHQLKDPLVLAWQVNACRKEGSIPLWDTCRLTLRGFPITEYLSKKNLQGQAELRWRFHKRWGMVAFAGAGKVEDSLGGKGENDTIPSYGVGLRWMVLESQRINVRVDYARSDNDNSAWYLSVSEAF